MSEKNRKADDVKPAAQVNENELGSEIAFLKKKIRKAGDNLEAFKNLRSELEAKIDAISKKKAGDARKKRNRENMLWGVVVRKLLEGGQVSPAQWKKNCEGTLTVQRDLDAALAGLNEIQPQKAPAKAAPVTAPEPEKPEAETLIQVTFANQLTDESKQMLRDKNFRWNPEAKAYETRGNLSALRSWIESMGGLIR